VIKPNKAVRIAVIALLLVSLFAKVLPFSWEAGLPVHNVNTGLSYATIQEAINANATFNGQVIRVDAGVYYENVVVNKSVSLVGENDSDTVIDGNASGNVIRITANRVKVIGFTIRDSMLGYSGVFMDGSSGDNISQNIVENNYDGIYVYGSRNDNVTDNMVSDNEYGIHLYNSSNNDVSGNNASGNMNGIHLDISSNNIVVGNSVWSNSGNGIYVYGSGDNTLLANHAFSNSGRGIRLEYSSGNTLSGNVVSGNAYGISLYGSSNDTLIGDDASSNNQSGVLLQASSDDEAISGNVLSNNVYGIWFIDSNGSTVSGNNVSSNDEYGVRLWNSSRNVFFYNNFIKNSVKNVEQPSNTSILNLWDNGAEGNYWGDYDATGTNKDGIGDKPYIVDDRVWMGVYAEDSYPLMGPFSQFSAAVEGRSYTVAVVSNSTIMSFQYHHSADNKTNTMTFELSAATGEGFCLISIPNSLIASPYTVTADQARPLSYTVVRTNGTYTWVYFTYLQSEHEIIIKPTVPPQVPVWALWWFWGILVLVFGNAVLGSFSIRYRRKVAEQTKILQAYSPFVIAEALFKADIERRGLKIREFEEKYGVKIEPRSTLEDVIRSLETKEKAEKEKS
jgi:parallel beta-helix repeat protein